MLIGRYRQCECPRLKIFFCHKQLTSNLLIVVALVYNFASFKCCSLVGKSFKLLTKVQVSLKKISQFLMAYIILYSISCDQEFFRAVNISWNMDKANISPTTQKRKVPQENFRGFSARNSKKCILNEEFNYQMDAIKKFPQKIRTYFQIFQKWQGKPPSPPSPASCAHAN